MSEQDEYDAYFVPFTLNYEDLDAIQAAEAWALSPNRAIEHPPELHSKSNLSSRTPPSPDEFDSYDLSEFSAEDFEQIDKLVLSVHTPPLPTIPERPVSPPSRRSQSPLGGGSPTRGDGGVKNGGPSLEIALEPDRNADTPRPLKDSWIKRTKRSPYEQFRRWNRLLSVTDITGPSWCEVQFDYGLRQKRHKKLADRPKSFVTAEGKTITVAHQVAAVNARTVTRGTSVHKVLEREIQPEAIKVEITTNEERWGLRLVNMLTSLHTVMGLGRCREMPVFGLIHDQIVTGIIDEIVREPLPGTPKPEDLPVKGASMSPNKRPPSDSTPPSPEAPISKKICAEPSGDQSQITSFFSPTTCEGHTAETAIDVEVEEPMRQVPVQYEPSEPLDPPAPETTRYSLHLSDTKTRIRPTLPPDEDSFAGRIQLMLYHRLLSNALSPAQPDIASSQPLDFDAFWKKANVDPTRRFSDNFLLQTGLPDAQRVPQESTSVQSAIDLSGIHCLNDLTRAWYTTVEALNAVRVDNTLTIVYRAQPGRAGASAPSPGVKGKYKERTPEPAGSTPASSNPSLSLSEQEARDMAAAIQASISDIQPGAGGDGDLARAIFESLRDAIRSGQTGDGGELGILTHPFGPPISEAMSASTLEGGGLGQAQGGSGAIVGAGAGGDERARARVAIADGLAEDPQLAWALQESLLARLEKTPALKEAISEAVASSGADAPAEDVVEEASEEDGGESGVAVGTLLSRAATEEPDGAPKTTPASPPAPRVEVDEDEDEAMITVAELETEAKIIGTKEFDLDNALLDDYLESVLAWWYGKRPPQGVDVELTRRCVTCEYRDGCEWREKKAEEALQKYQDRSMSGAAAEWL